MSTHLAGACHFCGNQQGAEFNEQYGVIYDGCKRGYGILRVWSLNGVRWGGQPSERCACNELQQCEGATADVTDDQIRAYLDRNTSVFREFLHREVRRDPAWFRTYLRKETRIAGRFPFQRPD